MFDPRPASPSGDRRAVPPTSPTKVTAVDSVTRVRVVRNLDELVGYSEALGTLAARSLEPNVFYEPWLLFPALRAFGHDQAREFVLIHRHVAGHPPELTGFFPLERRRWYKGLPIANLTLLSHVHCFLLTPLVRADGARRTLEAFLDWLRLESGAALMEFRRVVGEGPLHQLLVALLHERASPRWVGDWYTRALFRPRQNADSYARAAISGRHCKELRRKERRLGELGRLEYRELIPGDDAGTWLEQFLRLEASGWKGREGGALACSPPHRRFFLDAGQQAHRQGRLMLLGLFVDGRPLAMKCNFLAGPGSFAFKIAFDEAHAAWSPGLLLEMENIRRLHERGVQWMDSCADPEHWLINRLWLDRRTIQTVVFGTGRPLGDLAVAMIPLLKWLHRTFWARRPASPPSAPGEARARGLE